MQLKNSMQSHLQCSGSNISDIKKMVNRIDYWENFTGLCLGLWRHHENLSFFVKIKTRPEVLRKMHRPNFYRSYNKRNCIIECINNLQISLKVQMEKCCMVLQKYWWQIFEEKIIMQRDNNTFYIQHTSICPIPVINTYVQFTVQQFYYFLIFTLRQIFCTKENRRTISSLFPDTPETRRWCAGAGRGKREQYNTFSNRFAFIAPEVQL